MTSHSFTILDSDFANLIRRLANRKTAASLTDLQSGCTPLLGITDAAFTGAGDLLILDSRVPQLIRIDSNGHVVARIDRIAFAQAGIVHPRAIATINDTIVVADRARSTTRIVPTAAGWHFQQANSILPGDPLGVCYLQGELFVHSTPFADSATIYSLSERSRRAFGTVYRSPNHRVNLAAREGKLACASNGINSHIVLWAGTSLLHEVHAYRTDGTRRWIARMPARPPLFSQLRAGSRTIIPDDGFERLEALIVINGRWLLAQYATITPATFQVGRPIASIQTYVIDLRSGYGGKLDIALPLIHAASSNRLLVGHLDAPSQLAIESY